LEEEFSFWIVDIMVGALIGVWAGEWVTVEVCKGLLGGIISQLRPDEMQQVLKQASIAAKQEAGSLFARCEASGLNGTQAFLRQFVQSGEVARELQKPLQDGGKPSVEILVGVFEQQAAAHSEVRKYQPSFLRPWMEAFVGSYFEQVKGICFQVAKAQYLGQLAQRVDDVKFVGIAVPGEEVEKQEVLAQIFVMPDVREEQKLKFRDSSQSEKYGSFDSFIQELLNLRTSQPRLLEEQRSWAMRDRASARIPAQKVLNQTKKKAVLLGAPGSGKTMLVSYFALMLCERGLK
jgi:predicted NACHT family NTPase